MGAQVISIAAGVVGTAVAALGLVLAWYRHDQRKDNRRGRAGQVRQQARARTRLRMAVAASVVIVVLAAVGILAAFRLNVPGDDAGTSGRENPLSRSQYQSQVSRICLEGKEEARRLEDLEAQETLLGPAIEIEAAEVRQIRGLIPPRDLRRTHDEMLAVWERRVSLLESLYRRQDELAAEEFTTQIITTDELAEDLTRYFESLQVPECVI